MIPPRFFLVLLLTITCCKKPLIGKWSDVIQLSHKALTFNSKGDSALVTAKGKWWAISGVTLDTSRINLGLTTNDPCNFSYVDSNIQLKSSHCDTLLIKLSPNTTSSPRTLAVAFWAGDYGDQLKIIQNAQ